MSDVVIGDVSGATDRRQFLDGSTRSSADLPSMVIGRGVYQPGWRWSEHAGRQTGRRSASHIGYIESGTMVVRGADGVEVSLVAGQAFEVSADHDAWVVGDEPCVALDFRPK
jgi:hypothetical protein